MKSVLALATITFWEGIRNRSLLGIALFALFVLGLNIAVAGFFMRDLDKVTVDMNLSALNFAGLLTVYFVGINLMAKDIDKRTIHLVLSKPISRVGYVWGKYLGIEYLILATLSVLMGFSCATVALVQWIYPSYFQGFIWGNFLLAAFFVFVKLSVLNAIVLFFSTLTSSSFITLIFSVCSFIVGATIEDVLFYLRSAFSATEIAVSESLRLFIEIVAYIVPNLATFNFTAEAAHGLPIASVRAWTALGYGGGYIVVLLLIASLVFRRREFN